MCAAACISLTFLVLISALFGNLSLFAEHNTDFATISQYVFFSLPRMISLVLPFSVCIGVIAAEASFSRHVETIAMQSCSVSFLRISAPYIAVGLASVILMSILSFYVYPLAQRQADKIENVYIKKQDVTGSFTVNGGRFKVGDDIYYVEHLDISKGIMLNVSCYRIRAGRLTTIIRTDRAIWDKKGWKTTELETMRVSASGMILGRSGGLLPLSRGPADLVMAEPSPELLTLGELFLYRNHLKGKGIRSVSLDTQFHSRVSFAIAPIIMTLLVMPFGMMFPRTGGIARGISIGLILGLLYWALQSAMTGAGTSGYVHPALAAWSSDAAALGTGIFLMVKRRGAYV